MELAKTAYEFEKQFGTEEACIEYLRVRRWPNGFLCPRCGARKAWSLRARPLDECASCGHQVSLTAGTVFAGTRKPLQLWFRVMAEMLFSKRGCSALELTRRFPLSYKTTWTWLHKLRSCMLATSGELFGPVEVDETYLGGEDDGLHRGRSLAGKKLLVACAAECRGKAIGRIRLSHLPAASAAELCAFVAANVARGAAVHTDGWAAYRRLAQHGYQHRGVRQGSPKAATKQLPRVHRVFSLLDRWLLGTFHGSIGRRHLRRYLIEFVFRFNRRSASTRPLLFDRLCDWLMRPVPTYPQLNALEPLRMVGT